MDISKKRIPDHAFVYMLFSRLCEGKGHVLLSLMLFLLLFLFSPLNVHSQTVYFTDSAQLTEALKRLDRRTLDSYEFTCSGDFYSFLREDDFIGLYHIVVSGGIDYSRVMISYNDFRHYIRLSSLADSGLPSAECRDLDDVREAVSTLAGNRDGFILMCSRNLAEDLSESNFLHLALVRSGVKSYRTSYSVEAGIIRISDPAYLEVPYAVVQDFAQFSFAVDGFQSQGVNDFYIVFDMDLMERILADPSRYTIMIGSSKLGSYRSSTDPNSGTIRFSDVEFTNAPREICRTVDDVPDAIRRMGTAGIRDFELIFPFPAVFEALSANDFALLLSLEASAGMSNGTFSYSSASDRIIFTDAEITTDAVMLTSLADAITYTEAQVNAGSSDIHLFCTAGLYDALMGDLLNFAVEHSGMNRIYDLIAHDGIFRYDLSTVRAANVINIHINQLYPGKAVVMAVRDGVSVDLSARERETWSAAAQIAAEVRSADEEQTARAIHDWLCVHVDYAEDDSTDEDDNAVGAILNGRANCDGYADAFYLIGSLAGLNVRYQHGDSYYRDPVQQSSAATHLWNLAELGGAWRMIDVTWDDQAWGISYQWFSVGRAAAADSYFWNEDMTVPIAEY